MMQATTNTKCVSYDAPSLSSMSPVNMPAKGVVGVSALGAFFAVWDTSVCSHVELTAGRRVEWASDSTIYLASVHGIGPRVTIALSVGVQVGSVSEMLSYSTPALYGCTANGGSTGLFRLSVLGSEFGSVPGSVAAAVGGSGGARCARR